MIESECDDTSAFLEQRDRLFAIVYALLGSASDADDVLQQTWLAWSAADRSAVRSPRAYLVRVAVNAALAHRSATARRRENYVGSWLPEPTGTPADVDSDDHVLRAEAMSVALLVVLESLSPTERAVFVLHEAFGFPHTEIAAMLDRSPAAVRQLAHRAREHVRARRPRYEADRHLQRRVTEAFMAAAIDGDLEGLLVVLAPDATLWTDGGGKGPATSLQPVHGREAVARLLTTVAAQAPAHLSVRYQHVGGDWAAVVLDQNDPFAVLVLDLADDGLIHGVYSVTNPDKLTRIH
ncbi:RNA polymerase sigma factor SigJ [Microlunatus soli]|uniref:RNA polymerase sigma-70 factor, ECF subfamily n=1 Tax=Microlunatus soli TaxID=630515 RepID=A0A1H1QR62_9ACTN|nr:RNA polymerase sigma factor SigJ [Microlunatus soli]SDS25982.1 RNA polymerase sigma-70 factor, ECF subfamily [Microlunatus soli]